MAKKTHLKVPARGLALAARDILRFLAKHKVPACLRAYEQRMDTLVTHPVFGYRVSYRRVLEIQTRLLARVVTGELARYAGFETR